MSRKFSLLVAVLLWCGACGSSSPTSPSNIPITITGSGVSTYTYTKDVASILNSDCVQCHNSSQHEAGLNFTTYNGVLNALTPGSAQSAIVLVTQPSGPMYANLSGDRNQKAGIIYDWVVNSHAAQ